MHSFPIFMIKQKKILFTIFIFDIFTVQILLLLYEIIKKAKRGKNCTQYTGKYYLFIVLHKKLIKQKIFIKWSVETKNIVSSKKIRTGSCA